ncbi:hypothetical protein HanIR_Chr17g0861501 [Helianthus annuus]|nr:hypothetical protein HanIR_Chr17g0861501 [Helianthus annuus]
MRKLLQVRVMAQIEETSSFVMIVARTSEDRRSRVISPVISSAGGELWLNLCLRFEDSAIFSGWFGGESGGLGR